MLAVLGVALVVLTMGPVCTDAKGPPAEKARARPFLAMLVVCSLTINVTELFPVNALLGLVLAGARARSARRC